MENPETQGKSILQDLKQTKSILSRLRTTYIYKREFSLAVEGICKKWYSLESRVEKFGVPGELKDKYHSEFTKLLSLTHGNARKTSYADHIDAILSGFKDDVILPLQKNSVNKTIPALNILLSKASDNEVEYLNEALSCAETNCFRASTLLGWCAAISRLHHVVEKNGFKEFNKKSQEMKDLDQGRYTRFKKSFNVNSLTELQATVFDSDLLWVLEYWGFIDSNQHERLSICYTMRNNCAHPGEAKITEANLNSFYSDLDQMIFSNPKCSL